MYQVIQKDPALVLQGPQGLLRLYPVNENAVRVTQTGRDHFLPQPETENHTPVVLDKSPCPCCQVVEEAGAVLVFCATGALDFVMPCGQYGYVVDMSLATGFALLEAAEQGLDTCIVCAFEEDAVKRVLGIPEEMRVVSMIAMGYGDDDSPRKQKKALEEIVSYDHF